MRPPSHASRRRLMLAAGAALLLPFARAGLAAGAKAADGMDGKADLPIEIGLMPYMPTVRLLEVHEPLRRHIEKTFGRRAVLSSAPDFRTFQQRVLRGDFDLALTGPNIGWQAYLDAAMLPIAVSRKQVVIQIVVATDSDINTVADLRGKTVATIDAITTTSQTTARLLRESGLEAGRDVQLLHEKTPFNSAQAVALGEVAAAGFPNVSTQALTPEIRSRLRIIKQSAPLPGIMFISRKAPAIPSPGQFQAALFRFAQDTQAGRAYIKDLDHEGLVKPDFKSLRALDSLVPEVRRIMAGP